MKTGNLLSRFAQYFYFVWPTQLKNNNKSECLSIVLNSPQYLLLYYQSHWNFLAIICEFYQFYLSTISSVLFLWKPIIYLLILSMSWMVMFLKNYLYLSWSKGEFICMTLQFSNFLFENVYFRVYPSIDSFNDWTLYFHHFELLFLIDISFCFNCTYIFFQKCLWLLFNLISTTILNSLGFTNWEPRFILTVELPHYHKSICIAGCVEKPVGN